jgi:uncharacterized protein
LKVIFLIHSFDAPSARYFTDGTLLSLIISTLLILFLAALIKTMLGFGEALLAMPLLALTIGLPIAVPLVGLMSFMMTAIIIARNWKVIDFRAAWRLIVSAAAGIPIGLLVVRTVPTEVVTHFLGLLVIAYSLYALFQPRWIKFTHPAWVYPFGFASGALGSAYNTGGPPLVVYANAQQWPPEQFRVILQTSFLPTSILIILSHSLSGFWTPTVLTLFAMAVPVILLAFWVGGSASRYIPARHFTRLVQLTLLVLGVVLLVR